MPTITYLRFWCSKCQDFTLHNMGNNKDCRICGTVTESYKLSEVPEDKLKQQRARYIESNNPVNYYMSAIKGTLLKDIYLDLTKSEPEIKIIEDDAGQKEISERRNRAYNERLKKHNDLKEEYKKFKGIGRNDLCACGSNVKYKNCCLKKFQENNIV